MHRITPLLILILLVTGCCPSVPLAFYVEDPNQRPPEDALIKLSFTAEVTSPNSIRVTCDSTSVVSRAAVRFVCVEYDTTFGPEPPP